MLERGENNEIVKYQKQWQGGNIEEKGRKYFYVGVVMCVCVCV